MKRIRIALLATVLALGLACQTDPAGNSNRIVGNSPLAKEIPVKIEIDYKEKGAIPELTVGIFPDSIDASPGQQIRWEVSYTSDVAKLSSVTVSDFLGIGENGKPQGDPQDIFAGNDSFEFANVEPNVPKEPLKTGDINQSNAEKIILKYKVTAIVLGEIKVIVDPRIVVSSSDSPRR